MPVNWLKLLAFSFGAAVAALTGTLYAALFGNVFPLSFYFVTLITIYTMVILGGSGNQAGVVLGALDHQPAARDVARRRTSRESSSSSRSSAALAFLGRRNRRIAIVAGATLVFGFVVHAIARAIDGGWVAGQPGGGLVRAVRRALGGRAGAPGALDRTGRVCGRDRGGARLHRAPGIVRDVVLVPTLYLGAFVWENVMLVQARAGALHRPRRDPDRADGPTAERVARRTTRGDRLMDLLELAASRCRSAG